MVFNKIVIGIGGNINSEDGSHPVKVCNNAINSLEAYAIQVEKQSKWYITEPMPKSDQPNFFNCVIIASTKINEYDVLKSLHAVEAKFGRKRNKVNEPRSVDLDLIDYSSKIIQNKKITIPHPRAHLRRFVIGPLAEIDPNWFHPLLKVNILDILKKLDNQKLHEFSIKKI